MAQPVFVLPRIKGGYRIIGIITQHVLPNAIPPIIPEGLVLNFQYADAGDHYRIDF
ncbi:hypothetical protein ACT691_16935 [Vibrio metschnikovii]